MPTVVCQLWSESQEGWGQSPDGYSLHASNAQRLQYVRNYNDSLPARVDNPPRVYEFANGDGYLADVNDEVFESVSKSPTGVRFYDSPPKKV